MNDVGSIVIAVASPVSKRDIDRFGIDTFQKQGFQVQFVDISQIVYPHREIVDSKEKFPGVPIHVSGSRENALEMVRLYKSAVWILTFGFNKATAFIYESFKEFDVKYAQCSFNSIPLDDVPWTYKLSSPYFFLKFERFWRAAKNRLLSLHRDKNEKYQPPRFILADGRRFKFNAPLAGPETQTIWGHTLDYDLYLRFIRNGGKISNEGNIVFLDEYIPFHQDNDAHEGNFVIDADSYYGDLCSFFEVLESDLHLPVVVAAHPRSRYEGRKDYFRGRVISKGATIELVSKSNLVLSHTSTSVNFAVLFRKPVLFLTADALKKTYKGPNIRYVASLFGKQPININRVPANWKKNIFYVHEPFYEAYLQDYIKTSNSPNHYFWEIVSEYWLKNKNVNIGGNNERTACNNRE